MQEMQKVSMMWILTQQPLYSSSSTSGSFKLFLLVFCQQHPESSELEIALLQLARSSCLLPAPAWTGGGLYYWRPGLQWRPVGQRWTLEEAEPSQHLHYYYCTTPNSIHAAISSTQRIKEKHQTFEHKYRKFWVDQVYSTSFELSGIFWWIWWFWWTWWFWWFWWIWWIWWLWWIS